MSSSPNLPLLLKQIGTYLAKAKAKGPKQEDELETARAALNTIVEFLYGKLIRDKCMFNVPRNIPPF
jgi:hypothetical protein